MVALCIVEVQVRRQACLDSVFIRPSSEALILQCAVKPLNVGVVVLAAETDAPLLNTVCIQIGFTSIAELLPIVRLDELHLKRRSLKSRENKLICSLWRYPRAICRICPAAL